MTTTEANGLDAQDAIEATEVEGDVMYEDEATEVATISAAEKMRHEAPALADLRQFALNLPADRLGTALAEYQERRDTFREWLHRQLVEGVHYGFPPGTEPQVQVKDGVKWYKPKRGRNAEWYPETAWQPKPSFYQSGADFICDLMGVRPEYESDVNSWKMAGEIKGMFCMICRLVSRSTGEILGEGPGIGQTAQHRDHNGAIKMAKKSSKIAAVLDTYGLSDLFTQDLENGSGQPPRHGEPERDESAPEAQPRGDRVEREEAKRLWLSWREYREGEGLVHEDSDWVKWFCDVTGMPEEIARDVSLWSKADFSEACKTLTRLKSKSQNGNGENGGLF